MPWELPQVMDPDMAKEGLNRLQSSTCLAETTSGIKSNHLKVSALETNWYMRNQLLKDSDWAGMAHSLEIRVPLVDIQLIKQIAPLIAGKHSITKRQMAGVPTKPLPANVLNRPKTGFSVPVREWLTSDRETQVEQRGLKGWADFIMFPFANGHICHNQNR